MSTFAVVLGGACSSKSSVDLPSDVLWSSLHFDYHARTAEPDACPDVLGALEDHFAKLQSYLGFAWQAGTRVEYYKFTNDADFASHSDCPPDAGGCALGTSVETSGALDEHELVHAYLRPTGFPPWIFVEGLAVALSCTSTGYAKPTLTYDQLASIQSGAVDSFKVFDVGAWLIGYMLDTFGPTQFMSLYASLPNNPDTAAIDAAFLRIYGQSLASIWAKVVADDQPRNACVWECSRSPIALDGTQTTPVVRAASK